MKVRRLARGNLIPVKHRRFITARICITVVVGIVALAYKEIGCTILIDIRQQRGVRLRELTTDGVFCPGHISLCVTPLFIPPDAIPMRGSRNNIRQSVGIYIEDMHLGAVFSKLRGVKRPIWRSRISTSLPPSLTNNNVSPTIAIDITKPQSV